MSVALSSCESSTHAPCARTRTHAYINCCKRRRSLYLRGHHRQGIPRAVACAACTLLLLTSAHTRTHTDGASDCARNGSAQPAVGESFERRPGGRHDCLPASNVADIRRPPRRHPRLPLAVCERVFGCDAAGSALEPRWRWCRGRECRRRGRIERS